MYIHISNLDRQITQADIINLLAAYTSIGNCTIHYLRNIGEDCSTYALVNISDLLEAETIVNSLHNTMLNGREIVIQLGK